MRTKRRTLLVGILAMVVAAGAEAADVMNYSTDLDDEAGFSNILGAFATEERVGRTTHVNANFGTAVSVRNSPAFDAPIQIENLDSFTMDFTVQFGVAAPVNFFVGRLFIQNDGPQAAGALAQAWLTTRRIGTTEFTVQIFPDEVNNPVTVLGLNAPGQTFVTRDFVTLSATRTSAGEWSVVRQDTGATIMGGTESTVATSSNLGHLQIFDNFRATATEPMVWHDAYQVTSVTSNGGPGDTPGDADRNGVVNDADLSLLLSNWDQDATGDPDGGWGRGEFDGIAPVQDADLSLLLANWTAAGAVPEPASAFVLLVGFAAATLRRNRK